MGERRPRAWITASLPMMIFPSRPITRMPSSISRMTLSKRAMLFSERDADEGPSSDGSSRGGGERTGASASPATVVRRPSSSVMSRITAAVPTRWERSLMEKVVRKYRFRWPSRTKSRATLWGAPW